MIAAFSDWPLPAKVLAGIMALLLAALLWSTVSSLVLLTYLGRPHTGWPLVEWWAYREWYPDPSKAPAVNALVERGLRLSALVSTGIPLAIGTGLLARHVAPRIAHDNARWASWRDLHKVGFSSQRGLYLARVRGRFVRLAGKQRKHMIVYAPTQSGKGVGTVIPCGLTADPMSLIFFDPKFEAFAATAGWQAEQGANVVLFAPLSPTGQTAQALVGFRGGGRHVTRPGRRRGRQAGLCRVGARCARPGKGRGRAAACPARCPDAGATRSAAVTRTPPSC